MGSQVRTDSQKGAVPSGLLLSWSTTGLLPAGTWDNVPGSNTVLSVTFQTAPTTSGSGMTQYSGNLGLWSGGAMSYEYSTYGAVICTGGGHAQADINNRNNAVLAWNLDTALWELVVPAWFDSSQITPTKPDGVQWNPPLFPWNDTISRPVNQWFQQDVDLNSRGEYANGIVAADHTYFNAVCVPSTWGGASKGSLVTCGNAAPGTGGNQGLFPSDPQRTFSFSYLHEADLTAKTWKRFTNPGPQEVAIAGQNGQGNIAPACFDTNRGKIYYLNSNMFALRSGTTQGPQNTFGICVASGLTRTTTVCPLTFAQMGGGNMIPNETAMAFVPHATDSTQDVIVHWNGTSLDVAWANWIATHIPGGTNQNGGDSTAGFKRLSAGQVTGTPINMSASPAGSGGHSGGFGFTFCPDLNAPNGAICAIDKCPGSAAGNSSSTPPTIYMLLVPSDRMNGTWQWTSQILNKASGTNVNPNDWGANESWSKFQYARTAKCFLLCDRENLPMRMFRPTGLV